MSNGVKISDSELVSIKDLRLKFDELIYRFGKLYVDKKLLDNQFKELEESEKDLNNQYVLLRTEESKFISVIESKYGKGVVDIETGIFSTFDEK